YKLKVLKHDPATGAYDLEVTDLGADLSFKTKNFTIKRGETVALAASVERKDAAPVAAVPTMEEQIEVARWVLSKKASVLIVKDGRKFWVRPEGNGDMKELP